MSAGISKTRFVKSDTKVSSYDRANAFLLAAILITGFFTGILFIIWVNSKIDYSAKILPQPVEIGDPGEDNPDGFADDAFDPGVEDFPEIETPQLAQAIEAITDAVSTVRANSDNVSGSADVNGAGKGAGSREAGTGGDGEGVPEYQRWKINYEADDINEYKLQLSQWEIHIGVLVRSSDDVFRVSDPAGTIQVVETDREQENKKLYFIHKKQRMLNWDKQIAASAGVDTNNVNMIQFYSQKARARIFQQENELMKKDGRELKDIKRTIIKLAAADGGYDFIVEDIIYGRR